MGVFVFFGVEVVCFDSSEKPLAKGIDVPYVIYEKLFIFLQLEGKTKTLYFCLAVQTNTFVVFYSQHVFVHFINYVLNAKLNMFFFRL